MAGALAGAGARGDAGAGLGHQQVVQDVQDGVHVAAGLPTPVLQAGVQGPCKTNT